MKRKLFCEINGLTYRISVYKERLKRYLRNFKQRKEYCRVLSRDNLEHSIYKHRSLILRQLGNNDITLQRNKKVNLSLAAPRIDGIVIPPGGIFSFWNLVGKCSKRKGYLEGVTISNGKVTSGTAGGMCQMTNLLHWMILHSPLEIIEHHHHHKYDLFPDYKRQIPFGTGTSIMFNYLDYQFVNNTKDTFQIRVRVSVRYLEGDLRVNKLQSKSYHIEERNHHLLKKIIRFIDAMKFIKEHMIKELVLRKRMS